MANAERNDPLLAFQFGLILKGNEVAGFSEVTGLDVETDVEKFREGGDNVQERQLVGPSKFPSRLVLKRGMTKDGTLWEWHQKAVQGEVRRQDIAVVLFDAANKERWRWSFRGAVPVKWTGPAFRAAASELAIETLEIIHKGFVPGAVSGPIPERRT